MASQPMLWVGCNHLAWGNYMTCPFSMSYGWKQSLGESGEAPQNIDILLLSASKVATNMTQLHTIEKLSLPVPSK